MPQTSYACARPIDILLVDDDEADVLLTVRGLEKQRLHNSLTVANNGWEALAMLRGENGFERIVAPDLIILDLNMPKLNGRETLLELKNDENLKHIPVIVLTTSESSRDIEACYQLQASCYLTKPADLTSFQDSLEAVKDFWLSSVRYPQK
ncbi:MAG: response regulator [Planctomycetales bacterium]|nr:response regulator [Planctomycetales bacterium]